jgi:hypothetical protein
VVERVVAPRDTILNGIMTHAHISGSNPSGKTRHRQKLGKGHENIVSEKLGEKIRKTQQTLKNT